jgi:hypothetical protein
LSGPRLGSSHAEAFAKQASTLLGVATGVDFGQYFKKYLIII